MKEKEIKNKILKFLSANDVNPFSCGYAIHSKTISEVLKVNYEKIKKIMKEMKKEGLVVYENKSYIVIRKENSMKRNKMNKYKYKIVFKNHNEAIGDITAKNLDEVHNILCKNKFTKMKNGTKAFYWNANEINMIEVELVEEGE